MPHRSFLTHEASLGAFRRKVLDRMLTIMLVLGTIALAAVTVDEFTHGDPKRVFTVYLPAYMVFAAATLIRSIPFAVRAAVLVFVLGAVSVSEFYYFGVGSVGYMYAFAAVTIAGVIFGLRAGLVCVAIGSVVGLGFAASYSGGLISPTLNVQQVSTSFLTWVPPTASFLVLSAASITVISFLLQDLDAAVKKTKDYARQLSQERDTLSATLREREVLIQEIDHRVGNILQLLNSLVRLELDQQPEGGSTEGLRRMAGRIHILSAVYNAVDRSQERQRVDLSAVALRVCQRVLSHHDRDMSIVQVQMEPAYMPVDTAVPVALLIGEFIDYAIHQSVDTQGLLRVQGFQRGHYELTLTLPQPADSRPGPSCMAMVGALVNRVKGTMEWLSEPHAGLRLYFSCA